jgi:hypothetical protein
MKTLVLVFWVKMSYGLARRYKRFGLTQYLHLRKPEIFEQHDRNKCRGTMSNLCGFIATYTTRVPISF